MKKEACLLVTLIFHAAAKLFIFLDSETPSGSIDTALDHSHLADAV